MKNKFTPAILIGRKGSTGFPGKNTALILGKPLAQYPMETALNAPSVSSVYLSTDDEQLMKLGKSLKINVIIRPPELCSNEALGEDAFAHAFQVIRQQNQEYLIDKVVLLFCNSPTVNVAMIEEGIRVLDKNPDYDSAVSVSRYNMWSPLRARRINREGLLKPFIPLDLFDRIFGASGDRLNCDRDSQGDVLFADMGLSIVRPYCLENLSYGMLPQKWMGQKIYPIRNEAGLDIDYDWQVPQIEYWIKNNFTSSSK